MLMGKARLCDTDRLLRWAANRQMRQEGGFQGRTNKLVDGCYSFWQGGIFPLMHRLLEEEGERGQDTLDTLKMGYTLEPACKVHVLSNEN